MDAEEVTVVTVTDQMTVESPIPFDGVVAAFSFEARTVEEIGESVGRVSDDGGAPPIGQRSSFVGIVKSEVVIAMAGKNVVQ